MDTVSQQLLQDHLQSTYRTFADQTSQNQSSVNYGDGEFRKSMIPLNKAASMKQLNLPKKYSLYSTEAVLKNKFPFPMKHQVTVYHQNQASSLFDSNMPNQATKQTMLNKGVHLRATNHRNDPFIQKMNSFATHRDGSPHEKLEMDQAGIKTGGSRDFSNFKDTPFTKARMQPFPVNDVSKIESSKSKKKMPLLIAINRR